MRPPERWPLHPAPAETESLSSWLRRIAASYGMITLRHDGFRKVREGLTSLEEVIQICGDVTDTFERKVATPAGAETATA
jgi:hypothetical protein